MLARVVDLDLAVGTKCDQTISTGKYGAVDGRNLAETASNLVNVWTVEKFQNSLEPAYRYLRRTSTCLALIKLWADWTWDLF
jgi:hypothetical protein